MISHKIAGSDPSNLAFLDTLGLEILVEEFIFKGRIVFS